MELKIKLEVEKYKNRNLALAVSGGIDSLAMMYMIREWIDINFFSTKVTAINVDHRIRKESQVESEFVSAHAAHLGFDFELIKWKWHGIGNLQSEARKFRYESMSKWCKENNYQCIFVAHNSDDCCETILSNFLRGSGIDGISGIKDITSYNSIDIVRPLINLTRQEIKRYLASKYLLAVDDISNYNQKYKRVAIRESLSILAKISNVDEKVLSERVNRTGDHIMNSKNAIDFYVEKEFFKNVRKDRFSCFKINREVINSLPLEILQRIIIKIIISINRSTNKPRFKKFSHFFSEILCIKESKKVLFFDGCITFFIPEKNSLYFCRDWRFIDYSCFLKSRETVWDGRFIFIRNDENSKIEIRPVGKYAHEICKKLDLKINKQVMSSLPMVFIEGKNFGSPVLSSSDEMNDYFSLSYLS